MSDFLDVASITPRLDTVADHMLTADYAEKRNAQARANMAEAQGYRTIEPYISLTSFFAECAAKGIDVQGKRAGGRSISARTIEYLTSKLTAAGMKGAAAKAKRLVEGAARLCKPETKAGAILACIAEGKTSDRDIRGAFDALGLNKEADVRKLWAVPADPIAKLAKAVSALSEGELLDFEAELAKLRSQPQPQVAHEEVSSW